MKHGKALFTPTSASLADGLIVPTVGVNSLATGGPLIDKMVTVSEAWIAIAILRLIEMEKVGIEGTGKNSACRRLLRVPERSGWQPF